MKPLPRRHFIATSASALAGLVLGSKARSKSSRDRLFLFDGDSLDGWRRAPFPPEHKYGGGRWQVVDGAIQGQQYPASNDQGSILLSDQTFGDFELSLELWPDWGCDSGVFLRCTEQGQCLQVKVDYLQGGSVGFLHGQGLGGFSSAPIELHRSGPQADIDVVQAYDAVARDGLLHAADAADWRRAWRFDGWNTLRVRCVGRLPDITTWINDVKIMEMASSRFRPRHRIDTEKRNWDEPSAYDAEEVYRTLGSEGFIGLQIHPGNRWSPGGVVRYRNISLQPLG